MLNDTENYFTISKFEEGWGMENADCEEQLYDYCLEELFIPEEKIEELAMNSEYELEVILHDLSIKDIEEDWYVNLIRVSKIRK